MRKISIYIDDSGIFHRNHQYFIYAGYIFLDKESKESAKRQYKDLVKKISKSLNRADELKSFGLEMKHRRALYNVMRKYESLAVSVDLSKIYLSIMSEKNSIHRYKDYALKLLIKEKIKQLMRSGLLKEDEDVELNIYIDEQLTASNGYYCLRDSVYEELKMGISNHNYGIRHEPILFGEVLVNVEYCDSSKNYLIQASDILANRHYNSFIRNQPKLRHREKHYQLHLP